MIAHILRRLLVSVVFLFIAATLIFFLVHALPGDPVSVLLGESGGADAEMAAALRSRLGLDRPLVVQYAIWIKGDLGDSLLSSASVSSLIRDRLPKSLELILVALFVSVLIAIPLGLVAALHRGTWLDTTINVAVTAGIAVPVYVIGILAVLVFAIRLKWLPSGNYVSVVEFSEHLRYLILPAATLSVTQCATIARMARSSVIDVLHSDYVRTARAKGLRESAVRYRHILRNALIPVVTLLGLQIGRSIGGMVLVEAIFNWPGLSTLLISSVSRRDYPVIQGILLAIAVMIVSISFLVDMMYTVLDPRIRYD